MKGINLQTLQNLAADPAARQRAGLYTNILLIILIILALVSSLMGSSLPKTLTTITPPRVVSAPVSTISSIPSWHLFGINLQGSSLPKTSLNLRLTGVFVDSDAKKSSAAVSVAGAKDKIFTIGQQIMPNVTLSKVLNSKIYIDNQGRMEQLDIPRPMLQLLNE